MHGEIRQFFARAKLNNGRAFNSERVLECGSYDINGNPRQYFSSAKEYVGLDWRPGPGVDVVSLVHDYRGHPDGHFQFVIATSLIEHDPFWRQSMARMVALLADEGSIIITCGGPGFHEHELDTSPAFGAEAAGVFYSNRSANEIVSELTHLARFAQIIVEDDPELHDIRVFAIWKMKPTEGFVDGKNGIKAEVVA